MPTIIDTDLFLNDLYNYFLSTKRARYDGSLDSEVVSIKYLYCSLAQTAFDQFKQDSNLDALTLSIFDIFQQYVEARETKNIGSFSGILLKLLQQSVQHYVAILGDLTASDSDKQVAILMIQSLQIKLIAALTQHAADRCYAALAKFRDQFEKDIVTIATQNLEIFKLYAGLVHTHQTTEGPEAHLRLGAPLSLLTQNLPANFDRASLNYFVANYNAGVAAYNGHNFFAKPQMPLFYPSNPQALADADRVIEGLQQEVSVSPQTTVPR